MARYPKREKKTHNIHLKVDDAVYEYLLEESIKANMPMTQYLLYRAGIYSSILQKAARFDAPIPYNNDEPSKPSVHPEDDDY